MDMRMTFFFGHLNKFLFKTWTLDTNGALFGAVIVMLILAVLYELLKTCREVLLGYGAQKQAAARPYDVESQDEAEVRPLLLTNQGSATGGGNKVKVILKRALKQYISPLHIVQSLLQVIQVGVGYILMLAAMTFNGYLFLAVCFGAGIGYYLFAGFRRSVFNFREQSDHCH